MHPLTEAIRTEVSADFLDDNTGHGLDHLDRVHRLAERLHQSEGGDAVVLGAACYLHDYHRVLEGLDGSHGGQDRDLAVERLIREKLMAAGFPPAMTSSVCACVAFADRYSFAGHCLDPPSLEARILRDADNLDALGAIGVARAFMFGGALGEPIWVPDVDPAEVYEAGTTISVVHHFHEKLLRVKDDMLTDAGRDLAEERHDFMVGFLDRLREEWQGSRSAARDVGARA